MLSLKASSSLASTGTSAVDAELAYAQYALEAMFLDFNLGDMEPKFDGTFEVEGLNEVITILEEKYKANIAKEQKSIEDKQMTWAALKHYFKPNRMVWAQAPGLGAPMGYRITSNCY